VCIEGMGDTTTVIAATLDQVGPRLKQLRAQRGLTLTSLNRVPLDDLVGVPAVGDPRIV
jgi:hypothetical protein